MKKEQEKLRKVLVKKHFDGSGDYVVKGYFHKWSNDDYVGDYGLEKREGALIEYEDGVVKFVKPFRIKFVEDF